MGMLRGGLRAIRNGCFWESYNRNLEARVTLGESIRFQLCKHDQPCLLNGFRMFLNPDDRGLSRQLWSRGFREPVCTNIYKRIIKQGMSVFDIGSNIGYYPLVALSTMKTGGFVYCFEPHPVNYRYLKQNIQLNQYEHMSRMFNQAITTIDGQYELCGNSHLNRCSIGDMNKDGDTWGVNLDNFCEVNHVYPDVVRMDIEGYEHRLIPSIIKSLEHTQYVFIEIHPSLIWKQYHDSYYDVIQFLTRHGFEPFYLVKEYGAFLEEGFNVNKNDLYIVLEQTGIDSKDYDCGFGLFLKKGGTKT